MVYRVLSRAGSLGRALVTRGWIGVQVLTVTQDIADSMGLKKTEGALVAEPQADGPAAKGGVASAIRSSPSTVRR